MYIGQRTHIQRTTHAAQDGDTPLHSGCWHGYRAVVECLARAGCPLQLTNSEGETALHVAAVRGNQNIVQFLVENGVSLDTTDNVCVCVFNVCVFAYDNLAATMYICSIYVHSGLLCACVSDNLPSMCVCVCAVFTIVPLYCAVLCVCVCVCVEWMLCPAPGHSEEQS